MRKWFVVLMASTAGIVLGGCGGSLSPRATGSSAKGIFASEPPRQILTAARNSALKASSMHYEGTLVSSGQTLRVDMNAGGSGGEGAIKTGAATARLRSVKRVTYFNANAAFYLKVGVASSEAELLAGKWLEMPANTPGLSELAKLTNSHHLISSGLIAHGRMTKTKVVTMNGVRALGLRNVGGQGSVLYVAVTGRHYPVKIVKAGNGSISFSHWNEPLRLTIPSHPVKLNPAGGPPGQT